MTVVFPLVIYLLYTAVLPAEAATDHDRRADWPAYFLVSMAAYGALGAAMGQAVPVATERARLGPPAARHAAAGRART